MFGFNDSFNLSVATAMVLHHLLLCCPEARGDLSTQRREALRADWYVGSVAGGRAVRAPRSLTLNLHRCTCFACRNGTWTCTAVNASGTRVLSNGLFVILARDSPRYGKLARNDSQRSEFLSRLADPPTPFPEERLARANGGSYANPKVAKREGAQQQVG